MAKKPTKRQIHKLPKLRAPLKYQGKFTKWTPENLRKSRQKWAAAQGAKGYSAKDVAEALGITEFCANRTMKLGGWDPYAPVKTLTNA